MLTITSSWVFLMFFLANSALTSSFASAFTITNNCPYTIWPGTLAGSGTPQLSSTGFLLDSGQSVQIPTIPGWSGRIWGRTGCQFDESGVGTCQTGDCGGKLECDGMGATPPASLFEITLGTGDEKDFYDVSIVDGYNLPLVAAPQGDYGGCNATGCVSDINTGCPKELQVVDGDGGREEGGVVACKSACGAFGLDQYCCSGEFGNPTTCRPSYYSTIFKRACPRAYSYAFDDGTSIFTCKARDYAIAFCPNMSRTTTSNGPIPSPNPPMILQDQHSNGEVANANMVSSSNILSPIQLIMFITFLVLALDLFCFNNNLVA
ncbi:pathogenesis-related thaumatin superfamily protein [Actinidia rufa]|uniref:Pathogenesis-related thaumatin superfamily protein n=1 Tax=Actinidia rufa TaxID=165716 RepID=A0A7J0E673_9ERIC|nr:pathogenesis-related thaumatin superfamily protein [Actinidia rufa]